MCMQVHMLGDRVSHCVGACVWKTKVKLRCSQVLYALFFETQFLTWLRMPPIQLDWSAAQAPRIGLPPSSQSWGCRCKPPCLWLFLQILRIERVSSCLCGKYFTGWTFGQLKRIFPANFRVPQPETFPVSIVICWFFSFQACDKDSQCGGGMCCAVSIWVKSIRICTPMGQVGDSCHPLTRKVSVCTGTPGVPSH